MHRVDIVWLERVVPVPVLFLARTWTYVPTATTTTAAPTPTPSPILLPSSPSIKLVVPVSTALSSTPWGHDLGQQVWLTSLLVMMMQRGPGGSWGVVPEFPTLWGEHPPDRNWLGSIVTSYYMLLYVTIATCTHSCNSQDRPPIVGLLRLCFLGSSWVFDPSAHFHSEFALITLCTTLLLL